MFARHFAFQPPALVNFVGGGGKTGLILRLMEEYCQSAPVIYTTTTRIHPPHPQDGLMIVSCDNSDLLKLIVERTIRCSISRPCKLVVTKLSTSARFLPGIEAGFGTALDRQLFPLVLNEADGARSMSLKMPREGEPVLMEGAEYLVPVIGMDCLSQPLGPEAVFRWNLVSEHFLSEIGKPITPRMASDILLHLQGVCRDWKPGVHIIPYINKADNSADDALAKELALALIHNRHFPVDRVVWGSLHRARVNSITARMQ